MFLRIRKNRASLVTTYRKDGKVKHCHLFALHHPAYSKRSFTFDVLRAKQYYNLTGNEWERVLAAAGPYLDWDEFGPHLRGEVSWYFPDVENGGPLVTQLELADDWAFDV
jgi:hypothetical protein